ncbi:MAG: hypothetical protein ACW967_04510 [Candidatus Hodarchaeales archaeon]|jgi:uncharacterized membrane protein YvbJ
MTFCGVCGESIGNAQFCPNCGTASEPSSIQTKNSSEPIPNQSQVPYQPRMQGMQGMMKNKPPMMIIGVIAMIIMMFFMFIFVFSNISGFWNR